MAFWVTGCRHYNAINFATSTQFGVKVGVNPEKIPEVQVGYNRQEAARVPVYLEQDEDLAKAAKTSGNPSVHTVLRQAQVLLAAGAATNDSSKAAELIKALKAGSGKSLETNLVYKLLFDQVACSRDKPDPTLLNAFIQAALDLPMETQRFHEQGKFIGTRNKEEFADAYSVLGTFSGDGAGSANTNSARVKIAQFFATGIAAQELARAGGAATVNPGAKSPEVLSLDERAKEREIGRRQADDETAFDQVAETIFMAGNGKTGDEPQKARVARAKQALSKNIRFPKRNGTTVTPEDEAIRIGALQSIAEVLDYLTEKYPGQGQRILENLKSN